MSEHSPKLLAASERALKARRAVTMLALSQSSPEALLDYELAKHEAADAERALGVFIEEEAYRRRNAQALPAGKPQEAAPPEKGGHGAKLL